MRRGRYDHTQVVLITDGTHIIDLYHPFEHLHELAEAILPERFRPIIEVQWADSLDRGRSEKLSEWAAD